MLALLGTYARKDLLAALERAVRFGAYSAAAVERILAAQAKPKSILEALADDQRHDLQPLLDEPVRHAPPPNISNSVRSLTDHGQANEANEAKQPGADEQPPPPTNRPDLRERLLADFASLKVPLTAGQLDAVLARADVAA